MLLESRPTNSKKKIFNHYSKIGQQLLLKNWPTNVTQKVIHKRYSKLAHKCYSKNDPQLLLKNSPTTVTKKLSHKRYSKCGSQTLLKN